MSIQEKEEKKIIVNNNCTKRIKSNLIGGVKTEAILVFIRTALERFFKKIDNNQICSFLNNNEERKFIDKNLRNLLCDLEESVVNVDYLLTLMQIAKKNPQDIKLRQMAKYEEPLMMYNDTMAKRVNVHFPTQNSILPEFLVVCLLSNWFLENEKSTTVYPFIDKYDFLLIIEKFEILAKNGVNQELELIKKTQLASIDIINHLKKAQYKFNSSRTSKKRKKK